MFWLISASLVAAQPAAIVPQAQVAVRIERPARAGSADWRRPGPVQKREILTRDAAGEPERLRLVEYQ